MLIIIQPQVEAKKAKRLFAGDVPSDHTAVINAFKAWKTRRVDLRIRKRPCSILLVTLIGAPLKGDRRPWCDRNFLSEPTLRIIDGTLFNGLFKGRSCILILSYDSLQV